MKPHNFTDLSGQRFGRLTVIGLHDKKNGKNRWLCKCDCGGTCYPTTCNLKNGTSTSCGCYSREVAAKRTTKHGDSQNRIYQEWLRMKDRTNGNHPTKYTEKHITVCEEWINDYLAFKEWALSHGYKDDLSLDRIDNSKGYSPDNCRWVGRKTQNRNKDDNVLLTFNGETHSIGEWSEILNMKYGTLYSRIKRGWSIKQAIERPLRARA